MRFCSAIAFYTLLAVCVWLWVGQFVLLNFKNSDDEKLFKMRKRA